MWKVSVLATLLAACGAKLADDPSNHTGVDASTPPPSDSDPNDPIDAAPNAPPIDGAIAAATRVVYLNFSGVTTLTKGPSDAHTNTAAWLVGTGTGTVPPYAGSQQDIDTIRDGVIARLNGIATVTVSRPMTGDYVMVMYGGTAAQAHSHYGTAVNQLDCGDTVKSDVAWIEGNINPTSAINTTMGAIGFGLGLSSVNVTDDCFCSWADTCQPSGAACTLRDAQTRDTNVGTDPNTGNPQICPGATQDEKTTFKTAFSP